MTTLRPLGPSVTFTASARTSTPRSMRLRASAPKRTSLLAMYNYSFFCRAADRRLEAWGLGGLLGGGRLALNDTHDVALLHDEELLAIKLDLCAGPLAEQDAVAGLDVEGDDLAGLVTRARADGDDFAFHRLLLGGVGDDDAATGLFFGRDAADDYTVVKGTKLHVFDPGSMRKAASAAEE